MRFQNSHSYRKAHFIINTIVLLYISFIFPIFPTFAEVKSDRQTDNLVGRVQMVKEGQCGRKPGVVSEFISGITYNRRGDHTTRFRGDDEVIRTFQHKYNSEGRIVEKLETFGSEMTFVLRRRYRHKKNGTTEATEQYPEGYPNELNYVTLSYLFGSNGALLEVRSLSTGMTDHKQGILKTRYVYGVDGEKKEMIRYSHDGSVLEKEVYESINVEEGKIYEVFLYRGNSKLASRHREGYDQHGNRTFSFSYVDLSANSYSNQRTYSYAYDDVGNWIMRVTKIQNDPNSGGLATCREITYYAN